MKSYIRWMGLAFFLLCEAPYAQSIADFAPRPKPLSAAELAQPCVSTSLAIDEAGVAVMTDAGLMRPGVAPAMAQRVMSSNISSMLVFWGQAHFPKQRFLVGSSTPRDACTDWAFLVKQWQVANGAAATGRMSVDDVRAVTMVMAQATAGVKQAKETAITRDAEYRASAPQLFGLPIGCQLALPACPESVLQGQKTTQTCAALDPYDSQWRTSRRDVLLRFAPDEQPGWVRGAPTLELLNGAVMGLTMLPSDREAAKQAISTRFGPGQVSVTRGVNAFGVSVVVDSTIHWSGDGLNAFLSDALGSLLTIRSPAFVRAEAEAKQRSRDEQNLRKATTGRPL